MKYSFPSKNNGRLKSIEIYEGESIETKCARILQDKEPITDTAPIIYTAKEDGVLPAVQYRDWETIRKSNKLPEEMQRRKLQV